MSIPVSEKPKREYVHHYTKLKHLIELLTTRKLALGNPEKWKGEDDNDAEVMAAYKRLKGAQGLYALCTAACGETHHHWKLYAGGGEGVRVDFDREKLKASLKGVAGISFDDIDYVMLSRFSKDKGTPLRARVPFVKRWGFNAEAEFRVIFETSQPQERFARVPIDITCVAGVSLSPWLADADVEAVKASIKEAALPHVNRVSKSRLTNSARWKKEILKLLGEPGPSARAIP